MSKLAKVTVTHTVFLYTDIFMNVEDAENLTEEEADLAMSLAQVTIEKLDDTYIDYKDTGGEVLRAEYV